MNTPPPADVVSIASGGPELLDRIGPLWHELRAHHASLDPMWRDGLLNANFADRMAKLLRKTAGGELLVLLATSGEEVVGYCVSTATAGGQGEVDSLFVAPRHRRRGVGRSLMEQAMAWLGERTPDAISVEVMACNDDALRFYARYGFYPRTVRMRQVQPG